MLNITVLSDMQAPKCPQFVTALQVSHEHFKYPNNVQCVHKFVTNCTKNHHNARCIMRRSVDATRQGKGHKKGGALNQCMVHCHSFHGKCHFGHNVSFC